MAWADERAGAEAQARRARKAWSSATVGRGVPPLSRGIRSGGAAKRLILALTPVCEKRGGLLPSRGAGPARAPDPEAQQSYSRVTRFGNGSGLASTCFKHARAIPADPAGIVR